MKVHDICFVAFIESLIRSNSELSIPDTHPHPHVTMTSINQHPPPPISYEGYKIIFLWNRTKDFRTDDQWVLFIIIIMNF